MKPFHCLSASILVCGLLIRLYAAISRVDVVWPDEHFQTLEPAYKVVFGVGLMSWEWKESFRSWLVPYFYIPVVLLCKAIGVSGGLSMIKACRAFTALAGVSTLVGSDQVAKALGVGRKARVVGLGMVAFSAPMSLWSAATLADTWAMISVWIALPYAIANVKSANSFRWALIGFLACVPSCIKVQMLPWTIGILLSCALSKGSSNRLIPLAFGTIAALILIDLFEAVTWGGFLPSFLHQIQRGNEVSKHYGVSPWWAYVPMYFESNGRVEVAVLGLSTCAVLVSPSWWSRFKALFQNRRDEAAILLVPFATLVVFFALLAHKEIRFLLPVFPLLYVLIGVNVEAIEAIEAIAVRPKAVVAVVGTLGLMAAMAWGIDGTRRRELAYTPYDVSALQDVVLENRRWKGAGSVDSILLYNLDWSMTRGYMGSGGETPFVGVTNLTEVGRNGKACRYALIGEVDLGNARRAGQFAGWRRIAAANRYILLKNEAMSEVSSKPRSLPGPEDPAIAPSTSR